MGFILGAKIVVHVEQIIKVGTAHLKKDKGPRIFNSGDYKPCGHTKTPSSISFCQSSVDKTITDKAFIAFLMVIREMQLVVPLHMKEITHNFVQLAGQNWDDTIAKWRLNNNKQSIQTSLAVQYVGF